MFTCTINVVDEARKSRIQQSLYNERQNNTHLMFGDMTTQVHEVDGGLLAFERMASELPPASSEHHKWWLNNGMLSHKTVPQARQALAVLQIHFLIPMFTKASL